MVKNVVHTMPATPSPWKTIIFILLGLWIIASLVALTFTVSGPADSFGNVAVIPIHGIISVGNPTMFASDMADSNSIVKLLEQAEKAPEIKAIVLDINSPGGTAVASEEIANAIKRSSKPTVALVREVGASGAFWVATSADTVFASPISITGSIGVIASYLDFSEFIEEHNVSYERMVAGRYKDIGSPFRDLTPEERAMFQQELDAIHQYFIEVVAEQRNLSVEHVQKDATGRIFLGREALELRYVDHLGDKYDVKSFLEKELGSNVTFVAYQEEQSLLDMLTQLKNNAGFSIEMPKQTMKVWT